jgi:hypothetical protein
MAHICKSQMGILVIKRRSASAAVMSTYCMQPDMPSMRQPRSFLPSHIEQNINFLTRRNLHSTLHKSSQLHLNGLDICSGHNESPCLVARFCVLIMTREHQQCLANKTDVC